jgi:hypothetical protein
MKINNFKVYLTITILALVCAYKFYSFDKENQKLQTQIDELHLIFNQKFLQEMSVNKPVVRFEF